MIYIGIDIAKFKHFVSVVSSDGKIINYFPLLQIKMFLLLFLIIEIKLIYISTIIPFLYIN